MTLENHKYRQTVDYWTMIESETWGKVDINMDVDGVSLYCDKARVSITHAEFDQVVAIVDNFRKMLAAGGVVK